MNLKTTEYPTETPELLTFLRVSSQRHLDLNREMREWWATSTLRKEAEKTIPANSDDGSSTPEGGP